jgi:hypothetical protein
MARLVDKIIITNLDGRLGSHHAVEDLLKCRNNLATLRSELRGFLASQCQPISTKDQRMSKESRWIKFLQLSCERTVSTNCRYLQRHLSQLESQNANLPTWSELRNEIVRSAAETLHIYEELIALDNLRYAPNFL